MNFELRQFLTAGLTALGLLSLAACGPNRKITRTDANQQIDLSGDWNDTDSQLVAKEMITDSLARPWLQRFSASHKGKEPRVIVGAVANNSHEHINTETFVKDLERELTNSGQVIFVASKIQRSEVRDEREDQAKNSSMDTAKPMGQEYGADFMLKGQINTIFDAQGKEQLKYYQTELELINMASNEKVWIGQKKIKKVVQYKNHKF